MCSRGKSKRLACQSHCSVVPGRAWWVRTLGKGGHGCPQALPILWLTALVALGTCSPPLQCCDSHSSPGLDPGERKGCLLSLPPHAACAPPYLSFNKTSLSSPCTLRAPTRPSPLQDTHVFNKGTAIAVCSRASEGRQWGDRAGVWAQGHFFSQAPLLPGERDKGNREF